MSPRKASGSWGLPQLGILETQGWFSDQGSGGVSRDLVSPVGPLTWGVALCVLGPGLMTLGVTSPQTILPFIRERPRSLHTQSRAPGEAVASGTRGRAPQQPSGSTQRQGPWGGGEARGAGRGPLSAHPACKIDWDQPAEAIHNWIWQEPSKIARRLDLGQVCPCGQDGPCSWKAPCC